MKLYYSKGACSLAVRITINELGLNCEYESVDLKTKKTEAEADYLTINPKGEVPALLLDNGEILTENAVIHQYLADTFAATELLPPVGDLKRYRVLEWLNFVSSDVHKSFGPLFNPAIPEQLKEEIFKPQVKKYLSVVNKRLADCTFLAEEHFTIADAYMFVMILWTTKFKMDTSDLNELNNYFLQLKNRPSIIKSLSEEKLA